MARRISEAELRRLRNDIDIDRLIDLLGVPWKRRDGYLRFLCPCCSDFHTATHPGTNLARCFRCKRNFNSVDLVMVCQSVSFLDAVRTLRRITPEDPQKA